VNVQIFDESGDGIRYATPGASGLDLQAYIDEPFELEPMRVAKVSTGIRIALPEGYEAQVRPRSGLASRGLVAILGTVDQDFRGQISVLLFAFDAGHVINPGDRIAQLVVCPVTRITPVLVDSVADLGETVRGSGGFGSTGTR
jgi:dUTP pyrophosphatase